MACVVLKRVLEETSISWELETGGSFVIFKWRGAQLCPALSRPGSLSVPAAGSMSLNQTLGHLGLPPGIVSPGHSFLSPSCKHPQSLGAFPHETYSPTSAPLCLPREPQVSSCQVSGNWRWGACACFPHSTAPAPAHPATTARVLFPHHIRHLTPPFGNLHYSPFPAGVTSKLS